MLLIRTDWNSFGDYLKSLNKPARKNYKVVTKMYGEMPFREVEFEHGQVEYFMRLWEQQLVRGKHPLWGFPISTVEHWANKGELKVFLTGISGLQFIQKREGYWECHPPMYDKTKNPSFAKYMWFNLIRYAIEEKLEHLDFGGGLDNWREMIRRRAEFPNPQYKWVYVPQRAKLHPETEPDYYIERPSCKLLLRGL